MGGADSAIRGFDYQADVTLWFALHVLLDKQTADHVEVEPRVGDEDLVVHERDTGQVRDRGPDDADTVDLHAAGSVPLHVQVKYRGSGTWTDAAVRDLLLPEPPKKGIPRTPPVALVNSASAAYLLVTNQAVGPVFKEKWADLSGDLGGLGLDPQLEKVLAKRVKAWASDYTIPPPSSWPSRFAAYPNATEEIVRRRILDLLTVVGNVPPACREDCLKSLRRLVWDTFRERDPTGNKRRGLSQGQIIDEIRNHEGSPLQNPSLRQYVVPPWAQEAEQRLNNHGRLVISGRSGVGKTTLLHWLVDRWRRRPTLSRNTSVDAARVVFVVGLNDFLKVDQFRERSGPIIVAVHDPWGDRDDSVPRIPPKELGRLLSQHRPNLFVVVTSPTERLPTKDLDQSLVLTLEPHALDTDLRRRIFASYASPEVLKRTTTDFFDTPRLPEHLKFAARAQEEQLANNGKAFSAPELDARSTGEATQRRVVDLVLRLRSWYTLEASLLLALTEDDHLDMARLDLLQRSLQRDPRLARCLPFAMAQRLIRSGNCTETQPGKVQVRRPVYAALSEVAAMLHADDAPRDIDGLPIIVELLVERKLLAFASDVLLYAYGRDSQIHLEVRREAVVAVARYLDDGIIAAKTSSECDRAWRRRAVLDDELTETGLVLYALMGRPRKQGVIRGRLWPRDWTAPRWTSEALRHVGGSSSAVAATRQVIAFGVLGGHLRLLQRTQRMPSFLVQLGWDLSASWFEGLTDVLERSDRSVEAYVIGALGTPPSRWQSVFKRIRAALDALNTRHLEERYEDDHDVAWDEWHGDAYADDAWILERALQAFTGTFADAEGGNALLAWVRTEAPDLEGDMRQAVLRWWRDNLPSSDELNWAIEVWDPELDGDAIWEMIETYYQSSRTFKRRRALNVPSLLAKAERVPQGQMKLYLRAVTTCVNKLDVLVANWSDLALDIRVMLILALDSGSYHDASDDLLHLLRDEWPDALSVSAWLGARDVDAHLEERLREEVFSWQKETHPLAISILRKKMFQREFDPTRWRAVLAREDRVLDGLEALLEQEGGAPASIVDDVVGLIGSTSWRVREKAVAVLAASTLESTQIDRVIQRLTDERSKHVRFALANGAAERLWQAAGDLLAQWAVSDRTDWEMDTADGEGPSFRVAVRSLDAIGRLDLTPFMRKTLREKWTPAVTSGAERDLAEIALSILLREPSVEDVDWYAGHLRENFDWLGAVIAAVDLADREHPCLNQLLPVLNGLSSSDSPAVSLFALWALTRSGADPKHDDLKSRMVIAHARSRTNGANAGQDGLVASAVPMGAGLAERIVALVARLQSNRALEDNDRELVREAARELGDNGRTVLSILSMTLEDDVREELEAAWDDSQ